MAESQAALATVRNVSIDKSIKQFGVSMHKFDSGIEQITSGMTELLGVNNDQTKLLNVITNALTLTYSGLMVYSAIATIRKAELAAKISAAIGETAVAAATFRWGQIALAAGTAIGIGIAFGAGYQMGMYENKRQEAIEMSRNADIGTPEGRRYVSYTIAGANYGY